MAKRVAPPLTGRLLLNRRIPWLHVFVEGVVIVGSILLAFGIEAGWDRYQAGQEERVILTDLQRDFQVTLDDLTDVWLSRHERASAGINELLWTLHRDGDPAPDSTGRADRSRDWQEVFLRPIAESPIPEGGRMVRVPDRLIGLSLLTPTFDAQLASLEALIQSGSLGRIQNRELRSALATFPSRLADANDEELLARSLAQGDYRRVLRGAGSLILAEMLGTRWRSQGVQVADWLDTHDVELRVTPELVSVLAMRSDLESAALETLRGLTNDMRAILELISDELG